MSNSRKCLAAIALAVVAICFVYVAVYGLMNPDMTDRRVFYNTWQYQVTGFLSMAGFVYVAELFK